MGYGWPRGQGQGTSGRGEQRTQVGGRSRQPPQITTGNFAFAQKIARRSNARAGRCFFQVLQLPSCWRRVHGISAQCGPASRERAAEFPFVFFPSIAYSDVPPAPRSLSCRLCRSSPQESASRSACSSLRFSWRLPPSLLRMPAHSQAATRRPVPRYSSAILNCSQCLLPRIRRARQRRIDKTQKLLLRRKKRLFLPSRRAG